MNVKINKRGNGACPICARQGNCRVENALLQSLLEISSHNEHDMEMVIYICPLFKEKNTLSPRQMGVGEQ